MEEMLLPDKGAAYTKPRSMTASWWEGPFGSSRAMILPGREEEACRLQILK